MKTLLAASFALSFLVPSALAQSAPGAGQDIAALSADLQNSRNSAASIHAQAEEVRRLKVLAAKESASAATAPPAPDEAEESTTGDVSVTIPTGNGLVPVRNKFASFKSPTLSETESISATGLSIGSIQIQGADLH